MSLEGIKKKILAEAEKEKEVILRAAKSEALKLEKEAEEKSVKLKEKSGKEIEKLEKDVREQARIEAELQARNDILKKKQELIDQVFNQTLQALGEQPEEGRKKLLRKFLREAQAELGSKMNILATKRDRGAMKDLVKKYQKVKLSKKLVRSRGGFIAASQEIEQDYTWDNVVSEKREELESEVAKILFR